MYTEVKYMHFMTMFMKHLVDEMTLERDYVSPNDLLGMKTMMYHLGPVILETNQIAFMASISQVDLLCMGDLKYTLDVTEEHLSVPDL